MALQQPTLVRKARDLAPLMVQLLTDRPATLEQPLQTTPQPRPAAPSKLVVVAPVPPPPVTTLEDRSPVVSWVPEPVVSTAAQPVVTSETPRVKESIHTPLVVPPPSPAPNAQAAPAPAPAPAPASTRKQIASSAVHYLVEPPVEVPRASRRAGEHGLVMLRVVVSPSGLPQLVQVARSSGYSRLDEQAVWAMRQARFKPYTEDGRPLEIEVMAPIEYPQD